MTVTAVHKDTDALTMTITSEFDATVDRVWQLWADPRLLERWWGPPTYPATVSEHDFRVGGRVAYCMTGPTGDRHGGWWELRALDPPHGLEFVDGFADAEGNDNPNLPVIITRVAIAEAAPGRTRMSISAIFPTAEAMEQILAMGMEEGMTSAMGQIDALL